MNGRTIVTTDDNWFIDLNITIFIALLKSSFLLKKQKLHTYNTVTTFGFMSLGNRVRTVPSVLSRPTNMNSSNSNTIIIIIIITFYVFICWPQKTDSKMKCAQKRIDQPNLSVRCVSCRVVSSQCIAYTVRNALFYSWHQNKLSASGIYTIVCLRV